MKTETRRANAMAAFIETVAKIRKDQMAGKLPMTKQANAANVAALEASAAKLRKGK